MEKENYSFLKSEYDKQVAAFKVTLEQKYAEQKGQKDLEARANEIKTRHNFDMADKSFGASQNDEKNMKDASTHNLNSQNWLLEKKKQQELQKFEKSLEKQLWKDHGGSRLKAKEKAFGLDDPEVKAHNEKLQKQKEQQQALEVSRQQSKGQISKEFNREQARQNIRAQFQDKGGKAR